MTFVLLPIAAVIGLGSVTHTHYVASARIQASSATIGSDTEADSVLNRVRGIATSRAIIGEALQASGVHRSAQQAESEISVSRLGSSAVMDIRVTDSSAVVARELSTAVAKVAVGFIGGQGSQQPGDLVTQFLEQQKQLYSLRQSLVASLNERTRSAAAATLSAQLSTVDQQLSDVTSTLRQLQVTIATDNSASVISEAGAAKRVRAMPTSDLVLAGIAGLVAGLLLASILEAVRPRVADARAFARELGVPLLGCLAPPMRPAKRTAERLSSPFRRKPGAGVDGEGPGPVAIDSETIVALRQAAKAANVDMLALVSGDDRAASAHLAASLTARLSRPRRRPRPRPRPGAHDGPWRDVAEASAGTNGNATNGTTTSGSAPDLGRVLAGGTLVLSPAQARGIWAARTLRQPTMPATPAPQGVRVVSINELDDHGPSGGCGLLVLTRNLTPYARLRRVRDIAAATGWPVIGVLDDRDRAGGNR
ncbi:MAG: hypothetical protein M3Y44_15920 [Actinomycetota bacterium]|nr:hypothetical protein [Actinomycetota bacterium]